jgi:6-phosphogluconolactonase
MNPHKLVFDGEAEWVAGTVREVVSRLRAAIAARRKATLLLSGGSTPAPVYRALAEAERVDWQCVHFFWGDERSVPPDHADSNFRMARETLLEPLNIASDDPRVHRFPTEAAPRDNAAMYEQNIRLFFETPSGEVPAFDVVLLGMGDDGHTASLFPGTEALNEMNHLTAANPVPAHNTTRLTVTFPLLNAARSVLILVRGAGKAPLLAEILQGDTVQYPIQRVQPTNGELLWILDAPAAAHLTPH